MKQKFFAFLITAALILSLLASCKQKDTVSSSFWDGYSSTAAATESAFEATPLQKGEQVLQKASVNQLVEKLGAYSSYQTACWGADGQPRLNLEWEDVFVQLIGGKLSFSEDAKYHDFSEKPATLTDSDKAEEMTVTGIVWKKAGLFSVRSIDIGAAVDAVKPLYIGGSYGVADFSAYTGGKDKLSKFMNSINAENSLTLTNPDMAEVNAALQADGNASYEYTTFYFSKDVLVAIAQGNAILGNND
ncbi:MAG: hypothetical protein LBS74_09010 [Oscillospiraceae bacterium]|jgi:hypothetical protein|nr:hypothetical protein [Oscillospiraceae bacterium]